MENLSQALESVQEELLSLYERDSKVLADQIRHWSLTRREQVLLHVAKKRGVTRVGMTPVPPLAVSQGRAKTAIEQELILQGLQESEFGKEPWTLTDTSRERLLADPPYCFKKGGQQVEVRFDQEQENVTSYVLWSHIYHQGSDDRWYKTSGKLDHYGLYFTDEDGMKEYYVKFADEAKKFGRTGTYEVLTPIPTSTSTAPGRGDSSTPSSTGDSFPKKTTTPAKKRRRPLRISSPRIPPTHRRLRGGGGGGSGRPGSGRQRELGASQATEQRPTPPSPEEVGRRTESTPRGSRSRLGQLLLDARDPPVLVLKGDANSLKCVRYRLKSKYSSLFCRVSTTFTWTAPSGPERWGRSRMMLTFRNEEQRSHFLDTVSFPKSVQFFLGSLEDF